MKKELDEKLKKRGIILGLIVLAAIMFKDEIGYVIVVGGLGFLVFGLLLLLGGGYV